MRRGRSSYVAVAAAILLTVSLWLPWFSRQVSGGFVDLAAVPSESGWSALGSLGGILVLAALVAAGWAVGRLPSLTLVPAGGLALLAVVVVTVDRLEATTSVITTSPEAGLLVAVGAAAAILLVGLVALLADVKRRADSARLS